MTNIHQTQKEIPSIAGRFWVLWISEPDKSRRELASGGPSAGLVMVG